MQLLKLQATDKERDILNKVIDNLSMNGYDWHIDSTYSKNLISVIPPNNSQEILIKELANLGKPLLNKSKPTLEEKKTLASIENLIKQIAFQ